jgi:UDP-N-acetylmuramate dehydrogenase
MKRNAIANLERVIESGVDYDFPMAKIASIRIGGPAWAIAHPRDETDLAKAMTFCRKEEIPFVIIGNCTNLLILDGGLEAVVIRTAGGLSHIHMRSNASDYVEIEAGAGLPLRRLMGFVASHGLSGMEFLVGIPGTAGGAVATNAGAMGRSIAEVLTRVRLVNSRGERFEMDVKEMSFAYRMAHLPPESSVSAAFFHLVPGKAERIRQTMEEHIKNRMRTQPLRYPSAGCIFKNPPGHFAGSLLDAAGIKGLRCGGAQISELHANFIINQGGARAEDVLHLIQEARHRVMQQAGIDLETEIVILGSPG